MFPRLLVNVLYIIERRHCGYKKRIFLEFLNLKEFRYIQIYKFGFPRSSGQDSMKIFK